MAEYTEFAKRMSYFIIGFAIFYYILDVGQKPDKDGRTSHFAYTGLDNGTKLQKFWNKFYLSLTTTTTLGNNSITPIHPLSQLAVAIQSFTVFVLITELVN